MKDKQGIWNVRLSANGGQRTYRTQCKIGNHAVYDGDPVEWLTSPMGLSCEACIRQRAVA